MARHRFKTIFWLALAGLSAIGFIWGAVVVWRMLYLSWTALMAISPPVVYALENGVAGGVMLAVSGFLAFFRVARRTRARWPGGKLAKLLLAFWAAVGVALASVQSPGIANRAAWTMQPGDTGDQIMYCAIWGRPDKPHGSRGTPLHGAVFGQDPVGLRVLLAAGAEPDVQRELDGWTSLHWAAALGHEECVRALLAHGATASIRTPEGQTAFDLAEQNGYTSVARLIRRLHPRLVR